VAKWLRKLSTIPHISFRYSLFAVLTYIVLATIGNTKIEDPEVLIKDNH
jgi:hypothetical protein